MGLFGRPGAKVIEAFREAVQIVAPDDPLLIPAEQVTLLQAKPAVLNIAALTQQNQSSDFCVSAEHFCIEPERFWFFPISEYIGPPRLRLSAEVTSAPLSTDCRIGQVDLTLVPKEPAGADLGLPLLRIRCADLLSAETVRLQAGLYAFADAVVRQIALLSAEELQVRLLPLESFSVTVKRFSFPALQKEPGGGDLFSRHTGPQKRTTRVGPVAPPDPPPTLRTADLQERLRWILTPPIHEVLSDPQLALPEVPFPYQTQGIKWLYDRDAALLADEMGLGKTMQAIIAARLLWRDGYIKHILVICPKSLISNWRKELRKWWPDVASYTTVVGDDRRWFLRLATRDVVVKIINYEALQRELDWLKEKPPHHGLTIIDEAQRIKNPKSKNAQAVKALSADRRWALTGTPLENSIKDLVSVFGFVRSSLVKETDSAERVRTAIKPYMLRRRQEEVLKDLPEKVEQDIEIELGDEQREAYRQAEQKGIIELNEKGDSITVTHVFALISKLRQICNFEPVSGKSAKAEFLLEELEEILESGRKALVFGQFIDETFGLKRLAKSMAKSPSFRTSILELHGEVRPQYRDGVVDRFQKDPAYQVLLLNYSVGGVGLNLQAASYVFLFDRWWNPAVEDQAIKRCHRLGQNQTVFAKRLYCKDTIEERILKKLSEKRRLFSHVIDEARQAPTGLTGLNEEDIFSLFNLTVRPRRTSQSGEPPPLVLDNLDPKQFENLVALIYEKDGFTVEVTGRSHDGGIDILAQRTTSSGKDRVIIQCKHQKDNVGRPVLQQLWGILNSDASYTRCDVVTSADFSREALEFAAGKRFSLINRKKLMDFAQRSKVANFVNL
jgi:superfamily II DNA or RNA helicase